MSLVPIGSLPVEVWTKIFSYLPSPDMDRSYTVCKCFTSAFQALDERRCRKLAGRDRVSTKAFVCKVFAQLPCGIRRDLKLQNGPVLISGKFDRLREIEEQLSVLRVKCPKAADAMYCRGAANTIRSLFCKQPGCQELSHAVDDSGTSEKQSAFSVSGGIFSLAKLTDCFEALSLSRVETFFPAPSNTIQRLALESMGFTRLPTWLSEMSNVVSLSLYGNRITLRSGDEKLLERVEILDLSKNGLKEVPKVLFRLENLRALYLVGNGIRKFPDKKKIFPRLTLLELADNTIESLPDSFAALPSLYMVGLTRNRLKVIPEPILRMKALFSLIIEGNDISSVPEEITELSQLRVLSLSGNRLGQFPMPIMTLGNLRVLSLDECGLKGIPDMRCLKSLEFISLCSNEIRDFTPLGVLPLKVMYIRGNKSLSYGPFESSMSNLVFCDEPPLQEDKGIRERAEMASWARFRGSAYRPAYAVHPDLLPPSPIQYPPVSFVLRAALYALNQYANEVYSEEARRVSLRQLNDRFQEVGLVEGLFSTICGGVKGG